MKILSVNFHVLRACDARCRFCFATCRDDRGRLATADAERVIDLVRRAGAEKLNFAGGEPTLHPDIGRLIRFAKSLGLTTSIFTNGRKLGELLEDHADALDWVGLSVDSGDEVVQAALGRGEGDHVARSITLADRCRRLGVRVKLNTVVTAATWSEDMRWLVRRIAPERWKVFQVLRVVGQNDGAVEPLLVSTEMFDRFVERHRELAPVAEHNNAMTDSYAMIDPLGRFYGDTGGVHRVSAPVLDVGVAEALRSVGFDPAKLEARNGVYAWAGSSKRKLRVIG